MTSQLDKYKLTFQLTARGGLLEVRARTLGGQSKAETSLPSQNLLDQLLRHNPAHLPSAVTRQVGQELHGCLTAGDLDELVADVFQDARQAKRPVHFELRFDPDQATLAQYPWEMITDGGNCLLVRDGLVDLTRYISYPQSPPVLDPTLHNRPILQVVSQPVTLQPLAPVELALERIQRLAPASFEQLQTKLLIERLALWGLHFDGHGALVLKCRRCDAVSPLDAQACRTCGAPPSEAKQVGVLAFECNGDAEWITTEELGSVLYNAQVGLALLLACETARVGDHLIFSGLAPGLILAGVPAVVGMQYPVADNFGRDFANAFYGRLLRSKDILDAMRTARSMTARASWYSPVLYLRCRPTPRMEERAGPIHSTRSIDTAAPEEAQEGVDFLARLWIRRPETQPLSQEQLRKELGLLTPVPIGTREAQAGIKFKPVEGRKLRRGEVEVECTSPTCDVYPERIKLFVDEYLDAPPAIFTCRGRRVGRTSLHFTVRQDGGQIAAASHPLQVIEGHHQPRTGIGTKSHAIPVQDSIPTADLPIPAGEFSLVVQSGAGKDSEFPLVRSAISIGRSPACDLVLQDPRVSRRHAALRLQHQGWVIADLGSSHGILVNGKRLSGPRRVQPGDEIRLGNSTLRLIEHGPITVPPAPRAQAADTGIHAEVAPAAPEPVRAESPQKAPRRRMPVQAMMLSVLLAVGLGAAAFMVGSRSLNSGRVELTRPALGTPVAMLATATSIDAVSQPPSATARAGTPIALLATATTTPAPTQPPPATAPVSTPIAMLATATSSAVPAAALPPPTAPASTPTAIPATATSTPVPAALPSATASVSTPAAALERATSTPALLQPPSSALTPALLLLTVLLWVVILSLLVIIILLVRRRRLR